MALINVDRASQYQTLSGKLMKKKDYVNGTFVAIKAGTSAGDRDLYDLDILEDGCRLGIIAEPFHPYTNIEKEEDLKFTKDDVVRIYEGAKLLSITVAKDNIDGEVALNDALKVKVGDIKLTKATLPADKASVVGYVVEKYNYRGQESVRIDFI